MGIVSSAPNGVQVETAAKDSAGAAAVLGAQTGLNADQILVPSAIGTNNEGQLEASPTYVGRLVGIRWGATGITGVTINSGGTGYAVNDVLTDNGAGATATRRARFIVTAVASGVITGIKLHEAGDSGSPAVSVGADVGEYSVEGTATNRATTGGTGSGATVDATFSDVQEVRFITADSSNTLTVHEAWTNGPATTENWRISYIIGDVATVTGLTLINKRVSDYSSSRRLRLTNAGTNGGWLFFGEGVSLETVDNSSTTVADFTVETGTRFDNGYLSGGVPVSGGYMIGTPAVNGELVFDVDAGGACYLYDFFLTCVTQNRLTLNGTVEMRGAKFFSASYDMNLTGSTGNKLLLEDIQIEGKATTNDTITIDNDVTIDGAIIIATNGFRFGTAAETLTVKGVLLLDNNLNFVTVPDNASAIFEFLNPTWNLDTSDQTQIAFTGTTNGEVREQYTIDLNITENDGSTPISGATAKLFSTSDDILVDAADSDANGDTAQIKTVKVITPNGASALNVALQSGHFVRIDEYTWRPFIVSADNDAPLDAAVALQPDADITQTVQATAITNGSGIQYERQMTLDYDGQTGNFTVGLTVTGGTSGATGVILADNDGGTSGTLVLGRVLGVFDDNETITDTSTGSATVNEPTLGGDPVQAITNRVDYYLIEYESGNGTAITIGDTITVTNAGTDTTGEAKHVRGDGTDGFVLLENWNGVAPDAGATLADQSGHSSSTTNPTNTFEFGYFIEGASKSVTAIYDYQQARAAESTLSQEFEDLLAIFVQNGAFQRPVQLSGGSAITRQAVASGGAGTGFYLGNESGTTLTMRDNQDDIFTPPVTINVTYTGLKDNTEVRVYEANTTNELAGVENATDGSADNRSVTFSLPAGTVVDVRFMNFQWTVPDRNSILDFTWPSSNTSIPITQVLDRVSDNP